MWLVTTPTLIKSSNILFNKSSLITLSVLSIPISKANLDKTFMKIRFQLIDPVRPKDFGPNKDGRLLGIGLISAQFE